MNDPTSERVRVHEFAKSAGLTSKEVLTALSAMGEFVSSASSQISTLTAKKLAIQLGIDWPPSARPVGLKGPSAPNRSMLREGKSAGPQELSRTPSGTSSARRSVPAHLKGSKWSGGARREPRHPDLRDAIQDMQNRIPIFGEHVQILKALGSQVIQAKKAPDRNASECSVATVRFSDAIENGFGITREVLFFYAPYSDFQQRTLDRALRILQESFPTATQHLMFIHAPDPRLAQKLADFSDTTRRGASVNIVPLMSGISDEYEFISELSKYARARDLFYHTEPVYGDNFFGRRGLLRELREDILEGKIVGIFGLRKSGKTSVLKQIQRSVANDSVVSVLIDLERFAQPPVDSTSDIIEKLRSKLIDALRKNGSRIDELTSLPARPGLMEFEAALERLLQKLEKQNIRVLVMLDEVEYLTPAIPGVDIVDGEPQAISQLLSILRSLSQEASNFSILLSGLTSAIIESGRLYRRPNPLFAWAIPRYLGPLAEDDAAELARTVGSKMAVTFSQGAIDNIFEASGGHAFLHRTLCSLVVSKLPIADHYREVTSSLVQGSLREWNSTHRGTIEEMLDHIRRYYPDESSLLELLHEDPEGFGSLIVSEEVAIRRLVNLGLAEESVHGYRVSALMELVL